MAQGKRKLAHEHARDGSHRASRHDGRFDGVEQHGTPRPPRDLTRDGKWLWAKVIDHLPREMLATVDAVKLYQLCRAWEEYLVFDNLIREGEKSRNVFITWKELSGTIATLARDFGLSPWDRSKLTVPESMSEDKRTILSLLSPSDE